MILLLVLMISGSLTSKYVLVDLGQDGQGGSDHRVKELPMVKQLKEKPVPSNTQEQIMQGKCFNFQMKFQFSDNI